MKQIYRSYKVNNRVLLYLLDSETQTMGFTVLPEDMGGDRRSDRSLQKMYADYKKCKSEPQRTRGTFLCKAGGVSEKSERLSYQQHVCRQRNQCLSGRGRISADRSYARV